MTLQFPLAVEITTESDVEQKVVMPFLIADLPFGLGIPSVKIYTKSDIRRFAIGKGNEKKLYYPDYLVAESGIPLLIIEAKKPGDDLNEAFREARLYAGEMNAEYPTDVNPLRKIIATDGIKFLAGHVDQARPLLTFSTSDLSQYGETLKQLQDFCSQPALSKAHDEINARIRKEQYFKPRRMLGSISLQHEEIGHNSFGATITSELAHIFNPSTLADRKKIAIEGYIPSRRRERYADPIDRVIRAAKAPSDIYAKSIKDTSKPDELISVLNSPRELQHQVILLVGGVGVGKTTFVDHLQFLALPKKTRDSTLWMRIDMNPAPVSPNEIYDWIRSKLIAGCQINYPDIDFDEISITRSVYAVEINRFRKNRGTLLAPERFDDALFGLIGEWEKDLHLTAQAYLRYCASERGLLPVVVLDNCDKRNRDEQLLMFEVAQWVRKEFRCLVVLPLREETYDNYRDQPPLDTAQKDLVFRIEPPLFHQVIVSRIQLALNEIAVSGEKTVRFSLPNGFHVDYPASDKAYFLKSILHSIFYYDRQIRRMIVGLSGRSIRRALEIFSEFCTSGHFEEDHIFKIKQSRGEYIPPLHVIMRVILRGNRRFYDTDHAYIKNIFALNERDKHPSYFVRLIILRWLKNRFHEKGPTSFKGYFPINVMIDQFQKFGVKADVVLREVEYLAKGACVITEDFRESGLTWNHTLRLAPAGFVHLDLINSVDVMAAFAEDTWFDKKEVAEIVRDRIITLVDHYQPGTAISNAKELIRAVTERKSVESKGVAAIFENTEFDLLTDLTEMTVSVENLEKVLTPADWAGVTAKYTVGETFEGEIINIRQFGFFIEFEPGISGLLHKSQFPDSDFRNSFAITDRLKVTILGINPIKRHMDLGLPALY